MKLQLKWLTPILLRLLSLSQVSLANEAAAALLNARSVHLVTGFYVGLAPNPQPRADFSLDTTSFVPLTNQQFAVPIMPLHLLGKKSWNVYNQDNIAQVKRDEAAAKAKEEAEEERIQEIDAERRIQILRGERPGPLPITDGSQNDPEPQSHSIGVGGRDWKWKKRKRAAEDDTDFELRIAREQTKELQSSTIRQSTSDAPLTDHAGHISLFPQAASKAPITKNAEAEQEASRKRKEYEDQYTMRFDNAAGFKQGLDKPWYSKSSPTAAAEVSTTDGVLEAAALSKDVWGNEDPRRKQREAERMTASDPLAAMRQGAAQVRKAERERKKWQEERDREMVELLRAEKERNDRRKRRRKDDDGGARSEDELEGFNLDTKERGTTKSSPRPQRDSREQRSERRNRDSHRRSSYMGGEGEKGRSRERHRDRDGDGDRHRHRRHHRH